MIIDRIILEPQQKDALQKMSKWWRDPMRKPYFVFSGCAGSGKTTLLNYFLEENGLDESVARMSLTGKAVQVLQNMGHENAKTIHSTIYDVEVSKDSNGREIIKSYRKMKKDVKDFDLFVVDECSVVNEKMMNDLLYFDTPILFVGDHNQLKPVEGKSNLLDKPDVRMEKPVRQAEGNSIIALSQHILKYGSIGLKHGKYGDNVHIVKDLSIEAMKRADQILVGKHDTRHAINQNMKINRDIFLPVFGDKIICKKNNWRKFITKDNGHRLFLTNGMMGTCVESVSEMDKKMYFLADNSDGELFEEDMDVDYLRYGKSLLQNKDYEKFDFGYAITVHSAQGSQWKNIVVISEPVGYKRSDRISWLYTAVTRASENVILVMK